MQARLFLLPLAWLSLACASVACSETTFDPITEEQDDEGTEDERRSSASSGRAARSSSGAAGTGSSGGLATSSGGGAGSSGGPLVGPEPGTPCPTPGELFHRACGECGVAEAFCRSDNLVGAYGACKEEPGSCEPSSSSSGGVGGSSSSGGAGGSSSGGIDRGPAPTGLPILVVGGAIDAVSSVNLPTAQGTSNRVRGMGPGSKACPLDVSEAGEAGHWQTDYAYFVIENPHPTAAQVELTAVGMGDGWLVVYDLLPTTLAEREACLGHYDNSCGKAAGPGCLLGAQAVTVPANSWRVGYVSLWGGPPPTWWGTTRVEAKVSAQP